MNPPELSIILLNHNNSDLTIECLKCLETQNFKRFEIIIVENNSTFKEKNKLFTFFEKLGNAFRKRIQILEKSKNYGFAKGNNIGIEQSRSNLILILNNDTEFESNFLQQCVKFLNNNPVDMMSPKIMYFYNKKIIWDAGGFLKPFTPGLSSSRGAKQIDRGQYDFITSIDYGSGCCLFIKKEVLDKIGLFDEDYFIYFEETDLCLRARSDGFKVIFYPHAEIYHKVDDNLSDFHKFLFFRNKFIFLIKFFSIPKIFIQLLLQPLQIFVYAINFKNKSLDFCTLRNCIRYIFVGIRTGFFKRLS